MGGLVSLAFHRVHPERVTALLLCDTGPAAPKPPDQRRAGADSEPFGFAYTRLGILQRADDEILASLGSIRVPTLLVCGALDERFLPATEYLTSRIPGAERVIIEGAGHMSNLDRPAAFNAAVGSFLRRVTLPS